MPAPQGHEATRARRNGPGNAKTRGTKTGSAKPPAPIARATHSPAARQAHATAARPHAAAKAAPARHTAAAAADAATLARVHAWEDAQARADRTTAARNAIAAAETPKPPRTATTRTQTSPADEDDATLPADSSALVRTAPELPRLKSVEEEATSPVLLPSLYDARGRLVVPPPLYGSHEVLLHQNEMASLDGLNRVRDDADLATLRRDRKLVPLPSSPGLVVDARLPEDRRLARPWTAQFLATLSRDFYATFHEPLQVNSAVRTIQTQQRLLRTNGNAAPISGDTASPHLTGQAVDIGKRNLTLPELAWMRTYLAPLMQHGKIDVEEEFQQSCFHISVYKNYAPAAGTHVAVAASRPTPAAPTY